MYSVKNLYNFIFIARCHAVARFIYNSFLNELHTQIPVARHNPSISDIVQLLGDYNHYFYKIQHKYI